METTGGESNAARRWIHKYRLTIVFAATAVLVIAVAASTVNQLIGKLAEEDTT